MWRRHLAVLALSLWALASTRSLIVTPVHPVAIAVRPLLQLAPGAWIVTVRVYPEAPNRRLVVVWGTAEAGEVGRSQQSLAGADAPTTLWSRKLIKRLPAGRYVIAAQVLDGEGRQRAAALTHARVVGDE